MQPRVPHGQLGIFHAARFQAEDASAVDLQEDIETARNEIQTLGQKSIKVVNETYAKLESDSEFFNSSLGRYVEEAKDTATVTVGKVIWSFFLNFVACFFNRRFFSPATQVDSLVYKYTGEAIDKNKNINSYKCILKVSKDETSEIEKSLAEHNQTSQASLNKQSTELEGLKEQVLAIEGTTSGKPHHLDPR